MLPISIIRMESSAQMVHTPFTSITNRRYFVEVQGALTKGGTAVVKIKEDDNGADLNEITEDIAGEVIEQVRED